MPIQSYRMPRYEEFVRQQMGLKRKTKRERWLERIDAELDRIEVAIDRLAARMAEAKRTARPSGGQT